MQSLFINNMCERNERDLNTKSRSEYVDTDIDMFQELPINISEEICDN